MNDLDPVTLLVTFGLLALLPTVVVVTTAFLKMADAIAAGD